ncbi:protein tpx2 [Phtheirospermum japonicum]|uniref:Protein tpx2 n=1 Tax=Phtheirospermum japonicum TaxID=374723 RepID=A0A830B9A3_9LAMI|nr:protein tpx2 [Phtheirospermum japonicum]
MEEEMVEDTVNEEEAEYSFTVYEIDLDYEFDAARFFDFSRDESPLETRQAELWFDSAGSYPPSPFVAMLVPREDILMENVNISPKSKGVETMNLSNSDSDVEADHEISATEMNYRGEGREGTSSSVHICSQQKFQNQFQKLPSGLAFYNHMVNTVNSENQTKLSKKPAFPRTSTLMKPTASQLAKQNRPQAGHSRSCVSVLDKTSKRVASTCVIENQAAKRQKLDGGHLRKVMGAVQLQQTSFVHKAPKRDGLLDGNMTHTKPRITIPRDPGLETANRAQRTREKSSKDENVTSTVRRFKALPLNRKILEAPSLLPKRSTPRVPDFQEFHLKTSERALQHSSATLKSTVPSNHSNKVDFYKFTSNLTTDCGSREPGRPSLMNNNSSRPDGCQPSHSFKALPLNKKILSSKGDIGIFRNFKKESTVPMEFNFQTEKRLHNNPPIDLFNKVKYYSLLVERSSLWTCCST